MLPVDVCVPQQAILEDGVKASQHSELSYESQIACSDVCCGGFLQDEKEVSQISPASAGFQSTNILHAAVAMQRCMLGCYCYGGRTKTWSQKIDDFFQARRLHGLHAMTP